MAYKQKGWSPFDKITTGPQHGRDLTEDLSGQFQEDIGKKVVTPESQAMRKKHKQERKDLTKKLRAEHGFGLGLSKKKTEPRAELAEKQAKERGDDPIGVAPDEKHYKKQINIRKGSPLTKKKDPPTDSLKVHAGGFPGGKPSNPDSGLFAKLKSLQQALKKATSPEQKRKIRTNITSVRKQIESGQNKYAQVNPTNPEKD